MELDIAIIGAGPAGLTAGIYALRKNLKIRVLEKKMAGGNTADAVSLENYTGFKEIKGFDLAMKMLEHFQELGGEAEEGIEIKKAEVTENGFLLELSNKESIKAKALIIATGTTHRKLVAENSEKFEGKNIHYCATCDGPLYKDKVVSVIGGGNSGVTNALFLADICKKVFLLEFSDKLRADETYHAKLKEKGVEVITNAEVFALEGDETLSKIKFKDRKTSEVKEIESKAVFVYIGLKPNNSLASELGCKTNKFGYITVDSWMKTSAKGVFAAGDITGGFAQTIVACGQGAIASESAYRFIKN